MLLYSYCYVGRQKAAANAQDEELTITKFFINSKIGQLTDWADAKKALLILGIIRML